MTLPTIAKITEENRKLRAAYIEGEEKVNYLISSEIHDTVYHFGVQDAFERREFDESDRFQKYLDGLDAELLTTDYAAQLYEIWKRGYASVSVKDRLIHAAVENAKYRRKKAEAPVITQVYPPYKDWKPLYLWALKNGEDAIPNRRGVSEAALFVFQKTQDPDRRGDYLNYCLCIDKYMNALDDKV